LEGNNGRKYHRKAFGRFRLLWEYNKIINIREIGVGGRGLG
jgi:hypothetical protein